MSPSIHNVSVFLVEALDSDDLPESTEENQILLGQEFTKCYSHVVSNAASQ